MTTLAAPPSSGVLGQAVLHRVDSLDDLDAFRRWAGEQRDWMGFDTETSSLDTYRCRHRMTQLGDRWQGWAFSPHWMGGAHEVMARYQGPMIAFNLPFDYRVLRRSGLLLPWVQCHDAQLITHLSDSTGATALKARASADIDPAAVIGEQKLKAAMKANGWDHATVPDDLKQYWLYGAMDPVSTVWLADKHWPVVASRYAYAYDLERAYSRLAVSMMDAGLMIDRDYINATISQFSGYRQHVIGWLGQYGITSPEAAAQVGAALVGLGLPEQVLWHTKTGQVQTDVKAMEHYAANCADAIEFIQAVQGAKKAGKVISTYLAKMLAMAGLDDVVHYSIHTIGAQRTSRSSISDPSMQNYSRDIPQVRGGFRPRPGHVLISWDADQIEMRLAAHFSGDRQLIADFAHCDANGLSFFLEFARTIYGPITKKDPRYTTSKNTAYGTVYGSGEETAAATAGVTLDVIQPIYRAWKARYRQLDRWARGLVNEQKHVKRPHTTTLHGRVLYARIGREYGLVDYKIQGTAAEFLKLAALNVEANGYGHLLRLPVHDELIAEVPVADAEHVLAEVTKILNATTADLKVPVTWSGTIMPERWVKT